MSKKCPNCGFSESDEATVCHICGRPLVEENTTQDFDYDFGSKPIEQGVGGAVYNQADSFGLSNEVPMTINPAKANKLKKNLYSWSSALIAICIVRFIFTFLSLEDVQDISEYVPFFEGTDLYGPVSTFVNIYYAALVVLVLFLVASIALMIFANKVNRCQFPTQDNAVFEHSKKAFFASIATTAVVAVYFVLEIVAVINDAKLELMLDAQITGLAQTAGAVVVDVLLVVGAVLCLVSSLKLSKSKKN